MRMSSISKQRVCGPGSTYARALGAEVRRHRHERQMTQAELGAPLTRSFVSAVEHGRTIPSMAALVLLASRLDVEPADLLPRVKGAWTGVYTARHGDEDPPPHRR